MRSLPIRLGLNNFYPHKIIEEEDYTYVIFVNVTSFILVMRIDNNTNEILYANGGTDYEYVLENYASLQYKVISDLLKRE